MAPAAEAGLAAGDKAPSFKIATDGGETVSSASLKGQPYVVYFYPKDDTSGCTKEAIDFSARPEKVRKAGCGGDWAYPRTAWSPMRSSVRSTS